MEAKVREATNDEPWYVPNCAGLITSNNVQGCELDIDAGDRTRVRVLPLHCLLYAQIEVFIMTGRSTCMYIKHCVSGHRLKDGHASLQSAIQRDYACNLLAFHGQGSATMERNLQGLFRTNAFVYITKH